MNYTVKFDIIERKSSIHIFVLFGIEIIYFIFSINTEPNSIFRNIGIVSFLMCILYWFWYRFSMRYIKFVGSFCLANDSITISIKGNEDIFIIEELQDINIRISGYSGKERSTYRATVSSHDGLRNFVSFKHKEQSISYEFFLKDKNKIKGLIMFLTENEMNVKVISDFNCKVLYQKN